MTESELQEKCCAICGCVSVDCMHIPNESGTADRRALGMRKGVPDLILVDKNVMFVELKRNEKLLPSEAQVAFIDTLKSYGVLSKVVGSERQFRTALRQVMRERKSVRSGVPLNYRMLYGSGEKPMEKVYKFFMDKQGLYAPNELFAIKFFSKQNKEFPWLCNVKDHYFVATRTSSVTSKLLMAGWDVIFV